MAKVTNAFETRDAKGNREDLSDTIYNIDPFDTPFMSLVGRRNATNTQFDWQTEALNAAVTTNAMEEGFELTRTAGTPTVRRKNVCQISKKDATVTGSQEKANAAGKASEMGHQMALRSKELKTDIEKTLLSDQPLDDGLDDGIRRTRAFGHWIQTNVDIGATGANPVSETAARTAGTQRAITENMIRKLMQKAYDNGAKPSHLITGSVNKLQLDGFTGRTNTRHQVDVHTASRGVTLYASDFGDLKIMVDRFVPQDRVYAVDPEMAKVAYYRPFHSTPIAKIGDAETRMIVVEYGLQVSNEKAHACAFDLFDTNAEYSI